MSDLKKRLDDGDVCLGAGVFLASGDIVEILSYHFDWLVVDLEHSAIEVGDLPSMIRAAERWDTAVLVRISSSDYGSVDRILDAGADGIVYPHVRTVEDAKRAVETTFFPPLGERGVGYGRALRYGQRKEETALTANDSVLCSIQIEDQTGLDNLESILSIDGIDAVQVGPNDLAASKYSIEEAVSDGYEFDIDDDIQRVADVAHEHDVVFGYPAADSDGLQEVRELGGQLIVTKFDASLVNDAAQSIISEFRSELE